MTLYRIVAIRDVGSIKAESVDDLISSKDNLSDQGSCWVYLDAIVLGNAKVKDDTVVKDRAMVMNNAIIQSNVAIKEYAIVSDFLQFVEMRKYREKPRFVSMLL